MERANGLSFVEAQQKLQDRPWLRDDLDAWLTRLRTGPPYKAACIFVDNSGADVVLGMIPFARELLTAGTKVILCANSQPALNDVTYKELIWLGEKLSQICPVCKQALLDGSLKLAENGQASPCLDLSRIDGSLAELQKSMGVDLVILEGMGRAIHTNYNAEFVCDLLKVAVIKNQWLASRFGGDMFGVLFSYRPANKLNRVQSDLEI